MRKEEAFDFGKMWKKYLNVLSERHKKVVNAMISAKKSFWVYDCIMNDTVR